MAETYLKLNKLFIKWYIACIHTPSWNRCLSC